VLLPIKTSLPKFLSVVEKKSFDYKEAISLLLNEISEIVSVKISDIKDAENKLDQKQNEILRKVKKT